MLDRAGNAGGDIELWPDGLAGLADLAIGADPALLHQRTRAAEFGAEHVARLRTSWKFSGLCKAKAASDDDVGKARLDFVGSRGRARISGSW